MRSRDDNAFARPRPRGEILRGSRARAWGTFLVAALLGNGLYFLVLSPHLPEPWQHRPFAFDRGLGLDFLLCLAAYGLLRLARALV